MLEDFHVEWLHGKVELIIGSINLLLLCIEADLTLGKHMVKQGLTYHALWFKLEPLEIIGCLYRPRLHLMNLSSNN
jgi:hypothetical protein